MALVFRFAPRAEGDLEEIAVFIATESPRRALTFVAELRSRCEIVALNPEAYRLREEASVSRFMATI